MNKFLNPKAIVKYAIGGAVVSEAVFWLIFFVGIWAFLEFEFYPNQDALTRQKYPVTYAIFYGALNVLKPLMLFLNNVISLGDSGWRALLAFVVSAALLGAVFGVSVYVLVFIWRSVWMRKRV